MWRNNMAALIALSSLGAAGCAGLTPYEDDFACKNKDFGQCIHPEEAYRQAAASASDAGADAKSSSAKSRPRSRDSILAASGGYDGYRQALYTQLAALIEAPVTPMVAPPKTIRTLILPYADSKAERRLFMPRFVYSVLEGPRFVLGDYLSAPANDFAGALGEGLLIAPAAPENAERHEHSAPPAQDARARAIAAGAGGRAGD